MLRKGIGKPSSNAATPANVLFLTALPIAQPAVSFSAWLQNTISPLWTTISSSEDLPEPSSRDDFRS